MHADLPEPSPSPSHAASGSESISLPPRMVSPPADARADADRKEQLLVADAARYVSERSERRYRTLVETSTSFVWTADAHGLVLEMPRWRELSGLPPEDAMGEGWISAVHEDDQQRVRTTFAAATVLGRPADCELRLRCADGAYRWFAVRSAPVFGEQHEIVEWVGTWTSVDERKRTEETLALLADASRVLLTSANVQAALDGIVSLLVPRTADLCLIDLVDEDTDELRRAAVQHADAAKLAVLREMNERYPPWSNALYASATAVRTGQSRLLDELDDLYYLSLASDETHLEYIRAVAPRCYIATPLVAGGEVLGAIVVLQCESGRRFREPDMALFDELARRLAWTVHNGRVLAAARRARAAAESASRARNDFLTVLSHELRTPLNAIIGYTSLMADEIPGPINAAQREQLARTSASARHLVDMADHLLMLQRIESGEERPVPAQVDIAAACRDAAAMLEPEARAKGLRLDVAVAGGVGSRRTDARCLREILANLLSNAVKFTDQGQVSLVVRADAEWVRFFVRDTGHGIAPEHLPRVFDRFWQLETSHARPFTGGGLGLAVARDLARLLGGDVDAESVLGQGSTFTLRIPAAPLSSRTSERSERVSGSSVPAEWPATSHGE